MSEKRVDYERLYERCFFENVSISSPSMNYFTYLKKKLMIEVFERIIKKSKRKIKVLDIGCAGGEDLFILDKLCPQRGEFFGIEISSLAVRKAKEFAKRNKLNNFKFAIGDVTKKKLSSIYGEESFDFVILEEVIEHFPAEDQKNIINEVKKILRPGGILLITTPNKKNLVKNLFGKLKIKEKLKRKTIKFFPGEENGEQHVNELSYSELRKLVSKQLRIVRRGGLNITYGSPVIDRNPLIFSLWILLSKIFSICFPFWCDDSYIIAKKINYKRT